MLSSPQQCSAARSSIQQRIGAKVKGHGAAAEEDSRTQQQRALDTHAAHRAQNNTQRQRSMKGGEQPKQSRTANGEHSEQHRRNGAEHHPSLPKKLHIDKSYYGNSTSSPTTYFSTGGALIWWLEPPVSTSEDLF